MDFSIIIVNYNQKKLLETCIESINASKIKAQYEILIVDNNSNYNFHTQTLELEKKYPQILFHFIFNKENMGFGRANNQAGAHAKGDYLLFINTDVTVLNNSVLQLYKLGNLKKKAIVGGKLLNLNGSKQNSCGPFYSLGVVFIMLFLKGDVLGITRYSPDAVRQVDWVSGAFFGMKREDFESLGGFDEKMFMYMEEIELMYRFKKAGGEVVFTPNSICYHTGSGSSTKSISAIENIYKGLLYFYQKHKSAQEIQIVKFLLRAKAQLVILYASLTGNIYLKQTYSKALSYL